MISDQLKLRELRVEDELSFLNAIREFEDPEIQFAFEYDPAMSFIKYVQMVNSWPHGKCLPKNFVPSTYFVGVVEDVIVGRLSFRHRLNNLLERIGGHIGYAVIPSQRGRGYAKSMLRQSLAFAKAKGQNRILITSDTNNIASIRVIEANGGVLENITNDPDLKIQKLRYWIEL
jgi:predicted acetyltransferase